MSDGEHETTEHADGDLDARGPGRMSPEPGDHENGNTGRAEQNDSDVPMRV
jgi:hypothetical protein